MLHTSTGDDGTPDWRTLPELLAQSDIVSLHLPLTPQTASIIDRSALETTKPNALLVNHFSRRVVDGTALVDALRSGRLAAAGLDVLANRTGRPRQSAAATRQCGRHPARGLGTPRTPCAAI